MGKKEIQWLYGEIPQWIREEILTEEAGARLHERYGEAGPSLGRNLGLVISSILGALLVGSGIVLLVAHNWDNLTRPVRTLLSFGLLLAAQGLAGWVLWHDKRSPAWREGVATFLVLAVGACVSLIAQTYQIIGDPGDFLLTCTILSAPVIYLLGASVPAILYLAAIAAWAGVSRPHNVLFWILAAAVLPFFWQAAKRRPDDYRTRFLFWALPVALAFGVGYTLDYRIPGIFFLAQAALFALLYLAGLPFQDEEPIRWRQPLQVVGALGLIILSAVLSYREAWRSMDRFPMRWPATFAEFQTGAYDYGLTLLLSLAAVALTLLRIRRVRHSGIEFGVAPAVFWLAYLLARSGAGAWPSVIMLNLYLLSLGVGTLWAGLRKEQIRIVNVGMLIIAILIMLRFFDSGVGFMVRGVAFIMVGLAFLTANVLLLRRVKGVSRE